MTDVPPHRAERDALCNLLLAVGPRRPTLDEGWLTEDLAAHLFVREHKPIAAAGIQISALAALHERGIARVKDSYRFETVIDKLRAGPPLPLRPFDAPMNTVEYFVHHEDVRRGTGDTTPRPVDEVAEVEQKLWRTMERIGRFMTRRIKGTSVDLIAEDGLVIRIGKAEPRLTMVGRPGELALYLMGRGEAANVRVEGSAEALAALRRANLSV